MPVPLDWLLEAEPWLAYRVRLDLMGQSEQDPAVASARQALLGHPPVQSLVSELSGWPGTVISSHKSARQPYMFLMGSDFRKLKVPLVWYDLLHVLDVLSRFAWLHEDPRLLDMAGVLKSKADAQGRFTSESVWTSWKDWEFCQKKQPSRWLTLLAWRILNRIGPAAILPQ